jgi:hypothetical protein
VKGPWIRVVSALALSGACVSVPAADGQGLTVNPDELPWPRLQGRLSTPAQPLSSSTVSTGRGSVVLGSVSVMGDYYVTPSFLGPQRAGGFRATSGLLVGPRGQAWPGSGTAPTLLGAGTDRRLLGNGSALDASSDTASLPYVGIGYTGLSAKGGWSFSADLGMVSLSPGSAVKLGRVFTGTQALDETVRDMHWSPMLQLGVSYSF